MTYKLLSRSIYTIPRLRPLQPGPLFTKKTPSYGYRDPHDKPKTVWRPSHVYNGNPYTDNTASSSWIEALYVNTANLRRSCDTYMCQCTVLSLVQVLARRLFDAYLLPASILTFSMIDWIKSTIHNSNCTKMPLLSVGQAHAFQNVFYELCSAPKVLVVPISMCPDLTQFLWRLVLQRETIVFEI